MIAIPAWAVILYVLLIVACALLDRREQPMAFAFVTNTEEILQIVKELRDRMATVQDELAALQAAFSSLSTAFTAMQTRVTSDLANLQKQVATLTAELGTAGALTADQQTAFDAVVKGMSDLSTAVAAIDVPPAPPASAPAMGRK